MRVNFVGPRGYKCPLATIGRSQMLPLSPLSLTRCFTRSASLNPGLFAVGAYSNRRVLTVRGHSGIGHHLIVTVSAPCDVADHEAAFFTKSLCVMDPAFEPEAITAMTTAYEDILRTLNLTDRQDPLTEIVANKIIKAAELGERDTIRLRTKALYYLVTSSSPVPIDKPSPLKTSDEASGVSDLRPRRR
jgi:hypothetical protein